MIVNTVGVASMLKRRYANGTKILNYLIWLIEAIESGSVALTSDSN
jgi:hypothetical protein